MNKLIVSIFCLAAGFLHAAEQKVTLQSRDGTRLNARYFPVTNAKAYLLVVHGLQSHAGWFMGGEKFQSQGIASLAFDRRGSGHSEGKRGHATKESQFLEDFDAALAFIEKNNPARAPIHVMANSLGAVVTLRYLATERHPFASVILTTPGTHSTDHGDYWFGKKLSILLAPSFVYFDSPISDKDFVSKGAFLDWIKKDKLGTRELTAGFLRTVNGMRGKIEDSLSKIHIPMFVLLAAQDKVIDNKAVTQKVYNPHRGARKLLKTYRSEHYLFFGDDRELVQKDLENWLAGF